jgi:hypothetical protein
MGTHHQDSHRLRIPSRRGHALIIIMNRGGGGLIMVTAVKSLIATKAVNMGAWIMGHGLKGRVAVKAVSMGAVKRVSACIISVVVQGCMVNRRELVSAAIKVVLGLNSLVLDLISSSAVGSLGVGVVVRSVVRCVVCRWPRRCRVRGKLWEVVGSCGKLRNVWMCGWLWSVGPRYVNVMCRWGAVGAVVEWSVVVILVVVLVEVVFSEHAVLVEVVK